MLQRARASLTGTNSHRLAKVGNKNLTVSNLSRTRRFNNGFYNPIDLIIIDHLMYMNPERKLQSRRDGLSDLLKGAKELALGFADGVGVPILCPWHVSREGEKLAKASGTRHLYDAAECADAERIADVVLSIQAVPENGEITLEILKNRDGAKMDAVSLKADFHTSFFSKVERPDALVALMDPD